MADLVQLNFDSSNGTVATTTNSGLDDLILGTTGTKGTAIFTTDSAFQGPTGMTFTSSTANVAVGRKNFASGTYTQAAYSVRWKVPSAIPGTTYTFLQINNTTQGRILQLQYTSTGNVKINDIGNAGTTVIAAASVPGAGTSLRFSIVVSALSATAGAFSYSVYNAAGTSIANGSVTTANTGTDNMAGVYVGMITTGAVGTAQVDDLQLSGGTTTALGEYTYPQNPPSLVSQTTDNTYTADFTNSVPGTAGDTISYSAALVSGPTLTVTQPAAGVFVFTKDTSTTAVYKITGLESNNKSATANVSIPPQSTQSSVATSLTEIVVFDGTNWV